MAGDGLAISRISCGATNYCTRRRVHRVSLRNLQEGELRGIAVTAVGLGVEGSGFAATAPAQGDDPPFHILRKQNLGDLIWPGSQAMPDPSKPVGSICARQGGGLSRLPNIMRTTFADTRVVEPGKAPELPVGSQRVNPNDPLSDWIIPDCYLPGRVDCQ
jgi:hypothetical protein